MNGRSGVSCRKRRNLDPWRVGIALLVLCQLPFFGGLSAAASPGSRGRAIFVGKVPLKGRVRGHQGELPPAVVVCRNCHTAGTRTQGPALAPAARLAARLDRSLLLEPRPRRGGPPSSYDRSAFCKLLRTGIDPAYVLVARDMPIFDLDDGQCDSLWRFLTAEEVGR